MGLYISRALVELMHGRIWADSEGEGKGSTFSFTMPELAVKDEIIKLEKQIPMDKLLCGKPPSIPDGQVCIQVGFKPLDYKEQMKPLARPMKSAAEEL